MRASKPSVHQPWPDTTRKPSRKRAAGPALLPDGLLPGFPVGQMSFPWRLNPLLMGLGVCLLLLPELSPSQLYAWQQRSQGEREALKYTL